MKKMWPGSRSISSHRPCTSSINKMAGNDGNGTSDPSDLLNIFIYKFHINMASSITKTIPITPKSPLHYLSKKTCNSLFLTAVTPLEVKDKIDALNPSKSDGPDSIPKSSTKL